MYWVYKAQFSNDFYSVTTLVSFYVPFCKVNYCSIMSSFKCSRRELCAAFMEHGKHISTAERYIREHFNLSEDKFTCVIVRIQKYLLPQYKMRWNKSGRRKETFLSVNQNWLDGEFVVNFEENDEPSTSQGKRGRPCKSYELSAERSQKRKAIKLFRDSGLDQIFHSYVQGLRSIGEKEEAAIVDFIRTVSHEDKKQLLYKLRQEILETEPYTSHQALSIYIDLDLTKVQYLYLRKCLTDKNCNIFPSYQQISNSKKECYPSPNSINITNISVSVKLQALLDHTIARILKIETVVVGDSNELTLYGKWGCDGSSGQSEYKQVLTEESDTVSDSNLFIASYVPIRLVDKINDQTIWQNPTPSSVRYCRPLLLEYAKETPDKTKTVVDNIETEIKSLSPTLFDQNNRKIVIYHELFLTMIDGKISHVLTDTKSNAVCDICGASPKEMNNIDNVILKPENQESFRYGLSILHCWIRFMELILHISYNLSFKSWFALGEENKQEKENKKKQIQKRFREELGLIIDKPRQVSGNTNDGNTARRFFQNANCSAAITGVDENLIKRFHIILQVMSCGLMINAKKFGEYCLETARLYVSLYNWYYMPSSVHKVLIHGEKIINHNAVLPLGQLSEEAQESRNKDYKRFRLHHARKCSRASTNEDVFNALLFTSDPYVTSMRIPSQKSSKDLDEEALQIVE